MFVGSLKSIFIEWVNPSGGEVSSKIIEVMVGEQDGCSLSAHFMWTVSGKGGYTVYGEYVFIWEEVGGRLWTNVGVDEVPDMR